MDRTGKVFYLGLKDNKCWEKSVTNTRNGIFRAKNINGIIYGVGPGRKIYKYSESNEWQCDNRIKDMRRCSYNKRFNADFLCIDSFNRNDIYAVGGEEGVCHYDGNN